MITISPVLSDEAVPGAAVITDEAALTARLDGVGERLLRVGYLRYKPGTSLVAALRLASGPAFAYAVGADSRPKLAKTICQAPAGSVLISEPGDRSADRPTGGRPRPAGPRRPAADPGEDRAGPRGHPVPDRSRLQAATPMGGSARSGRRPPPDRAGVPTGRSGRGSDRLADRLPGGRGRWVPSLRATCRRRGLVVTSWLHGSPLDRLLTVRVRCPPACWHEVGVGLARLHSAASRPAGPTSARDERLVPVEAVATQLAQVLPEVGIRVRGLVDRLAAAAPAVDREHPVHGDFSTDQVIVDAGREDRHHRLGPRRLGRPGRRSGQSASGRAGPDGVRRGPRRLRQRAAAAHDPRLVPGPGPVAPTARATPPGSSRLAGPDRCPADRDRAAAMTGSFDVALDDLDRADLRLRRSWPRAADHLLLDLDDPVTGQQVAGQWFADPAVAATVAAATDGARSCGRVVVQPHGSDRKLTALAPLLRRPGARLVAHRPERRAVVALDGGAHFAKVVPARRLGRLRHTTRRAADLPIRTPALVPDDGPYLTSGALPGTPLSELLAGPRCDEALCAVGGAVARLHGTAPPAGSSVHGPGDELAVTEGWEQWARSYGIPLSPPVDTPPPGRSRPRCASSTAISTTGSSCSASTPVDTSPRTVSACSTSI